MDDQTTKLFTLPIEERLQLVFALWDSIALEDEPLSLTPSLRALLDQRLAEISENPQAGSPWNEVKKKLQRRGNSPC